MKESISTGKKRKSPAKARALEDHPLHTRLANPCFNRLKRSSFVKDAKRINSNLQDRLPREIESIQPAGRQPPWNDKDTNKISIYTTVPQMIRKSDFSKEMQRQITEESTPRKLGHTSTQMVQHLMQLRTEEQGCLLNTL